MTNRYRSLLQERADVRGGNDAIFAKLDTENRDPTPEERTALEAGQTRLRAVGDSLGVYEAQFALERDMPAVASYRGDGTTDAKPPAAPDQPTPFRSFGDQLIAVAQSARPGARVDERLLTIQAAATGSNEQVGADGGFLVQTDFSTDLLRRVFDTGLLSRLCTRIPISGPSDRLHMNQVDETSRATGSRWGGVQAYWIAEAASYTASRPKFKPFELKLDKLIALWYATDELMQDAAAMDTIAKQAFEEEFGWMLDNAIYRGTGAGQPLGILNSGALVSVSKETGQAATTLTATNVEAMFARTLPRSLPNLRWFINQNIWPQLFQLSHAVGVGGVPVFLPPTGISGAPFGSLFGIPLQPIEQASTLGTIGDIVLADLSRYILIDKGGIKQDSSIHVAFLTGEQVFRFQLRVNGAPMFNSAVTPANGGSGSTLSEFVALATRA